MKQCLKCWTGRRIFLHFEAVDSAFFAWVNGVPVGYRLVMQNFSHKLRLLLLLTLYRTCFRLALPYLGWYLTSPLDEKWFKHKLLGELGIREQI